METRTQSKTKTHKNKTQLQVYEKNMKIKKKNKKRNRKTQHKNKGLQPTQAATTGLSPDPSNTAPTVTEEDQRSRWGNDFSGKPMHTIRILLQNVGGIDLTAGGSVKLAALHNFMQDHHVDIAALTECNVAWQLVDASFYPSEQTKYWWENSHWSITHNRQEIYPTKHQRGGTCLVVTNQLSYRAQRPGDDKTGLGRWCWARLRGKGDTYLRIVSIYRPCPSNGPMSTYQQQVRFWSSKNLDCCPRSKLLEDLKVEIQSWQDAGEQVILLADMNDEVTAQPFHKFCQDLNLVEAISTLHGRSPLPTHQRGSKAIDGIYLSRHLLQAAQGGFLAFGEVMHSDHRAVWIDLRAELVGMVQDDHVIRPAGRRLKCQDPRITAKYSKDLSKEIEANHWLEKVDSLFLAAETHQWSPQLTEEYNRLDQELTQAKLCAERKCRKLRAGRSPWTPALTQAIQRIQYWKGVQKRARGGKISTTVLKRRATKGLLTFSCTHWQEAPETLIQKIKSAYDDYLTIKAQANRRETWLGQLIEATALAKDIPKNRLWKQIRQHEKARKQARQVKNILKQEEPRSGLTQVSIPDPSGQQRRILIHDKQNLEKACLDEAHKRFTQAASSPILQLSQNEGLHSLAVGSIAFNQILAGTYNASAISDPYTIKLLSHLGRPPGVQDIRLRSEGDYTQGWRKAKEITSSSPSGVHFGHYIAGIEDIVIGKINRLMATIPQITGISPDRWRTTLNVMLEKLAGNCWVEKLRIIMLFEADFNNNNKWLGRALMQQAEEQQALADEQYGSRKGKAAGIQCLNKRLFYDYIRLMRKPAALCSNDAKSCYDRIILIIAALCLCRLGAPLKATESMITTLAQLKHHVRSAFGNSTISQGQEDWPEPAAGIGQGNGAGPQIWAAVSTPLFEILREEGFVATFICALSKQQRQLAGFAFVDDTDLIVTDESNDEKLVSQKMQNSLQLWHGLLQATGGDLVPEKCFWYLIDFKWNKNRWQYMKWPDQERELKILRTDGSKVTIP